MALDLSYENIFQFAITNYPDLRSPFFFDYGAAALTCEAVLSLGPALLHQHVAAFPVGTHAALMQIVLRQMHGRNERENEAEI